MLEPITEVRYLLCDNCKTDTLHKVTILIDDKDKTCLKCKHGVETYQDIFTAYNSGLDFRDKLEQEMIKAISKIRADKSRRITRLKDIPFSKEKYI